MPVFHNKLQPHSTRSTVYQLRADVSHPDGMEVAFTRLTEIILPFVAKALYVKLPQEAEKRRSFSISNDGRFGECVSVPERLLWSVRLKFTRKDGTLWYYDISIVREDERLLFGIKIDTTYGADTIALQGKLPLVETLLASGLLQQGRSITDNMWNITTPEDVEELVCLIEDPNRTLPVVVISEINHMHWRFTPSPPRYLVTGEYLAERVKGYAIIAQLTFQTAYVLTDKIGKNWSVYDGACRTYYPGVDFENGIPAHHPCNYKDKIWYWAYGDQHGPKSFTSFLIDVAHRSACSNRTNWKGLYFVPDARILSAELDIARATHDANAPEREKAMQNHIAALQQKLAAAEEENTDWLTELETATETAEYYKQENANLRMQLDALRVHLRRQIGNDIDAEIPIPDNYKVMGDWAKEHLAGRLVLLPRAERAASKAEYTEVAMVYRALLILANEYRDSRMGIGTDKAFREALAKYGMDFAGSIDKTRAGQEGNAYFVNYPIGTQQRAFLQFHIVRGTRHEDRFCMRVYFFWDEDTNQVVVGWLPSHLSNRIS